MIQGAFSFSGRIGRLEYFMGCLKLAGLCLGLAILIGFLTIPSHNAAAALAFCGLCLLVTVPVLLWISFALQARRFRDIGLDPLYVIPGWMLLGVLDVLAAHMIPTLAVGGHHQGTMIGGLINLGFSLTLLFWPSTEDDGSAPTRRSEPRARMSNSPAAERPAPVSLASRAPRTGFGRRGVA